MTPRHTAALEARLLVELVSRVKNLNIPSTLEWGNSMELRCPCGEVFDSHRLESTVVHVPAGLK